MDASALVDLLLGGDLGERIRARLAGQVLHAPAHMDAECLSALGRLHRAGSLSADDVSRALDMLVAAPITRHPIDALLAGAWGRRDNLRLADALYVEVADWLSVPLVTTDARLRAAPHVEVVP